MGGGPCDFSVSPSPFDLDFGTLDFGTSDSGLTIMSDELVAASTAGDGDTVTWLLQEGVYVNIKDRYGTTGLHVSAKQGHDDIVKLFLDHEADVNIRDAKNMTPLMYAAWRGHLSIIRLLIGQGADLELRDYNGMTALMWAAEKDFPDSVSLSRGAQEGKTALQKAEKYGCFHGYGLRNWQVAVFMKLAGRQTAQLLI